MSNETTTNALTISRAAGYTDPAFLPAGYLLDAIGTGTVDFDGAAAAQIVDFKLGATWANDPLWQEEFGSNVELTMAIHGVTVEVLDVAAFEGITPKAWREFAEGLTVQGYAGKQNIVRPVRVVPSARLAQLIEADANSAEITRYHFGPVVERDFMPFHVNLKDNKAVGIFGTANALSSKLAANSDLRVYVDGVIYKNSVEGGSMADRIYTACHKTPIAAIQAWAKRRDERNMARPIMRQL